MISTELAREAAPDDLVTQVAMMRWFSCINTSRCTPERIRELWEHGDRREYPAAAQDVIDLITEEIVR